LPTADRDEHLARPIATSNSWLPRDRPATDGEPGRRPDQLLEGRD
jgi:hypothetical protein